MMQPQLTTQRILSIDAFRGITILVMIFVNELSGVSGIPSWMKHMPADADAMTFVDAVFPAFLFIVGMSVPFALNNRRSKGDHFFQLQSHIIVRTIGLLVLGVFMVNAEGDYNQAAMPLSIYLWSLLFYVAVIMVWNVYTINNKFVIIFLRLTGIAGLLVLASVYRGGEAGTELMTPKWWGILGLIGWAYLFASMFYQLVKGNLYVLLGLVALCMAYYAISKASTITHDVVLQLVFSQGGHVITTSIVLCGIILSLIFFSDQGFKDNRQRFIVAFAFMAVLFMAGYFLRPFYHISKIHGTPTWALYSAAWCCVIFCFLFWLTDLKKVSSWTSFFKPAASNPLLTYIIPFIVYAFMQYFNISMPTVFQEGGGGILWSAGYAVLVLALVIGLNKLHVRLQL